MRRRLALAALAASVLLSACATPAPSGSAPQPASTGSPQPSAAASLSDPTAAYLAQLDISALVDRAATYGAPVVPSGDPGAFIASLQTQ